MVAFVDARLQLLFVLLGDGCKDVKFVRSLCDVGGEQRSDRRGDREMEDLVTVRVLYKRTYPLFHL